MKINNALVWFKNDLRLHDNETLCSAIASAANLLLVYCIDPRHYRTLALGFRKTGSLRYEFLLQSLKDLDKNLQKIGGELLVVYGKPEVEIAVLAKKYKINTIYTQEDYAIEEQTVLANLKNNLPSHCELMEIWGHTLYHKDDIPYRISDIPMTSKAYRIKTTKSTKVRVPFLPPEHYNVLAHKEKSIIPKPSDLGLEKLKNKGEQLFVKGGESEALKRLSYYTFVSQQLTSYRWTRNQSEGMDYSSKFSPYLALGCLSPRTVYDAVKEYEEKIKKNQSTWWLIFELVWRDFFTFKGMRMGSKIYKTEGYSKKELTIENNMENFKRWCTGTTGVPFVDAHMRQLNQSGFMSNRGRVNCSSYLIHDLKIDWTWGAAYFEYKLLDYDPHVNWMNWHYQAYEIWYTNPVNQSIKYKGGDFIRKWVNELGKIDSNYVHIPWEKEDKIPEYPEPIEVYKKWGRAVNKILKTMED